MRPAGLKSDRIGVSLLPVVGMNPGQRQDVEPLAVGSLESRGDGIVGLISIPMDVLSAILQMLVAEHLKFIALRGDRFQHRRARLNGFRLEMKMTEDDLSPLDDDAG